MMKNLKTRTRLFRMMKVVNELHEVAIEKPTKENVKMYKKMNNLFYKQVNEYKGLHKW